jgi:hypothetical protein
MCIENPIKTRRFDITRFAAEDAWLCPTQEQGSLVLIPILILSDLRLPNCDGR